MTGEWRTILFLLVQIMRIDCDIFGELLMSVKNLHDKVDKISFEQTKTNEKVKELRDDFMSFNLEIKSKPEIDFDEKFSLTMTSITAMNHQISKIEEKMDEGINAILQRFAETVNLQDLHEVNNKTANQFERNIKRFNLEMSSKLESCCNDDFSTTSSMISNLSNFVNKIDEKMNETNEAIIQSLDEIVDGLSPKTPVKAILLVGGVDDKSSVEALQFDGTPLCLLESLNEERYYVTMAGDYLCGGWMTRKSCYHFLNGKWKYHTDLKSDRSFHVSWKRPDGDIQLMGGYEGNGLSTTEVVTVTGKHDGFELKYRTDAACGIDLKDHIILTGGRHTKTIVSRYDVNGWVKNLPSLNDGRFQHGCAHYYNKDNTLIYLVAGGYIGGGDTDSTELLSESGNSWTYASSLPSSRRGLRGVSLNNNIFMIGGGNSREILKYENSKWKLVSKTEKPRQFFAISIMNLEDIKPYCKSKK